MLLFFKQPNQLRVTVPHEVTWTWAHTLLIRNQHILICQKSKIFPFSKLCASAFQVMRLGRLYGAGGNLTSLIDAREIYLLYSLNISSITRSMQQPLIAHPKQRSATQLIENFHFYYFYLFPARDGGLLSRPTTRLQLFQSFHTKSRLRYSNPCVEVSNGERILFRGCHNSWFSWLLYSKNPPISRCDNACDLEHVNFHFHQL